MAARLNQEKCRKINGHRRHLTWFLPWRISLIFSKE